MHNKTNKQKDILDTHLLYFPSPTNIYKGPTSAPNDWQCSSPHCRSSAENPECWTCYHTLWGPFATHFQVLWLLQSLLWKLSASNWNSSWAEAWKYWPPSSLLKFRRLNGLSRWLRCPGSPNSSRIRRCCLYLGNLVKGSGFEFWYFNLEDLFKRTGFRYLDHYEFQKYYFSKIIIINKNDYHIWKGWPKVSIILIN